MQRKCIFFFSVNSKSVHVNLIWPFISICFFICRCMSLDLIIIAEYSFIWFHLLFLLLLFIFALVPCFVSVLFASLRFTSLHFSSPLCTCFLLAVALYLCIIIRDEMRWESSNNYDRSISSIFVYLFCVVSFSFWLFSERAVVHIHVYYELMNCTAMIMSSM